MKISIRSTPTLFFSVWIGRASLLHVTDDDDVVDVVAFEMSHSFAAYPSSVLELGDSVFLRKN